MKALKDMTDQELVSWMIAFLNGTSWSKEDIKEYWAIKTEVAKRSFAVQGEVAYLESVL